MNMSPALGVEILNRILKIIKDYCGMLTEEAVRKNFALIYELLDEAIHRLKLETKIKETYHESWKWCMVHPWRNLWRCMKEYFFA